MEENKFQSPKLPLSIHKKSIISTTDLQNRTTLKSPTIIHTHPLTHPTTFLTPQINKTIHPSTPSITHPIIRLTPQLNKPILAPSPPSVVQFNKPILAPLPPSVVQLNKPILAPLPPSVVQFNKPILAPVTHPITLSTIQINKPILALVTHPITLSTIQINKPILSPLTRPITLSNIQINKPIISPLTHPITHPITLSNIQINKPMILPLTHPITNPILLNVRSPNMGIQNPVIKIPSPVIPSMKTTKGKKISKEQSGLSISNLRIYSTGIRSGEYITSAPSAKQNSGTIIQVRGNYPPSKEGIENLDEITLRDAFNHIEFFSNMSPEERYIWLISHSTTNNDLYMQDVNLQFRFVKISGKFFIDNLSSEQINMLLKGNPSDPDGYWHVEDVYTLIPRKPGSRAQKHTLIFRPSNWVVMESETKSSEFSGIYFDLDNFTLTQGSINKPPNGYLRIFKVEQLPELFDSYAILSSTTQQNTLTWDYLLQFAKTYMNEMNIVRPLLEWMTPALHKSLIQKLIRTRCQSVTHEGKRYNPNSVLLTSISLLLLHPGSFVPNIQRFVGGMESAFKRLAVSIDEDSYIEDPRLNAMLYACALLSQQDRTWVPTDKILTTMFDMALTAQQDPRMYDYDWHNFTKITEWNERAFCYLALAELRSFESDIKMLGSIASRGGKCRTPIINTILFPTMPLSWSIDQHSYTEIAHYMPYTGETFDKIFNKIWNNATGVNSRNIKYSNFNINFEITTTIQRAQEQLWKAKTTKQIQRPITEEEIKFSYRLDPSWIAGLIGPLEIRVGTVTTNVVIRTDDIYSFIAVRKPGREYKGPPELSEEEKSKAISAAISILNKGIILKDVPDTISQYKNAAVYLRSYDSMTEAPEYELHLTNGIIENWSDSINMDYIFPIHPYLEPSIDDAILYNGIGIMENADIRFKEIIEEIPQNILRRLMGYLEGSRSKILLNKISRDGSGQELSVLPEDTGVFQILCKIACLYPAGLTKLDTGFQVTNGPLIWSLRDKISAILHTNTEEKVFWNMPSPDRRILWEHQREILETMKERHIAGKHGTLLWVEVGLGKSLNVTEYIHWLIEIGQMKKYCVWTLPPSALDSIKRELTIANLPFQVLDMTAKGKIKTIEPGLVNIIFHDHMRQNGLDEQLKSLAPQMLFIIDEFHKAMNKTLRTSITLEVVKLSEEFIGLSGTIIKDNNPDDLIPWLECVVEFELSEKNFYVAIGALISKKVVLPISVEREYIEAKMINSENYFRVVPKSLGGTSPNLNIKEALKYCYESITMELVRIASEYVKLGEKIFIVAKDSKHQEEIRDKLFLKGVRYIHLITKNTSLTLTPDDNSEIQIVITVKGHSEGYTLTGIRIMISPIIFSNQATRTQLEGRILRIGQRSPVVKYIIIHTGILSYIMKRYESARSLSEAMKGFAGDIGIDVAEIMNEI